MIPTYVTTRNSLLNYTRSVYTALKGSVSNKPMLKTLMLNMCLVISSRTIKTNIFFHFYILWKHFYALGLLNGVSGSSVGSIMLTVAGTAAR